jgi:hypothetical protein
VSTPPTNLIQTMYDFSQGEVLIALREWRDRGIAPGPILAYVTALTNAHLTCRLDHDGAWCDVIAERPTRSFYRWFDAEELNR